VNIRTAAFHLIEIDRRLKRLSGLDSTECNKSIQACLALSGATPDMARDSTRRIPLISRQLNEITIYVIGHYLNSDRDPSPLSEKGLAMQGWHSAEPVKIQGIVPEPGHPALSNLPSLGQVLTFVILYLSTPQC